MGPIQRDDYRRLSVAFDHGKATPEVTTALKELDIPPAALAAIGGEDHVISGAAELGKLYDLVSSIDKERPQGDPSGLDRATRLYALLTQPAAAPVPQEARAIQVGISGNRRSAGLADAPGGRSNRQLMGLDDASIDRSLAADPSLGNVIGLTAKKTAYDLWNMATAGFVSKHDELFEARATGKISAADYAAQTSGAVAKSAMVVAVSSATGGLAGGGAKTLAGAVLRGAAGGGASGALSTTAGQGVEMATGARKELDLAEIEAGAKTGAIFGAAGGAATHTINKWIPKPVPTPDQVARAKAWVEKQKALNPKPVDPHAPEIAAAQAELKALNKTNYDRVQASEIQHWSTTPERLKLAVEGTPGGQRVPLTYKNETQLARLQKDLKKVFESEGITDATVVQIGSGTQGWKGNPQKYLDHLAEGGTPQSWAEKGAWKKTSDTDFAVFSEQALVQAKAVGAPINAKYGVFKNGDAPNLFGLERPGVANSTLGTKLHELARKWNKEIYGTRDPKSGGFDFKLNLDAKPFTTPPTVYKGPGAP